jgi:hypothetical protein
MKKLASHQGMCSVDICCRVISYAISYSDSVVSKPALKSAFKSGGKVPDKKVEIKEEDSLSARY